jgi:DNA polymerase-3 subunit epsilon
MSLVCGIDFETCGLDPVADRVIEVGACLYDWNTGVPLQLLSSFIHIEKPLPEEIVKLTGITDELLENYGRPAQDVFADLHYLFGKSDHVMAHNGTAFDRKFYDAAVEREEAFGYDGLWLDSMTDIKFPPEIKTRNLRHLAAEYGFLNPFAHRAIFDVLTMLKLAEQFNLEDIIARSQEPTVYVQAIVSFDEKELAKERGYHWCGAKKMWWRSWKQNDYEADKAECGFRTVILQGPPE